MNPKGDQSIDSERTNLTCVYDGSVPLPATYDASPPVPLATYDSSPSAPDPLFETGPIADEPTIMGPDAEEPG